MTARNASAVPAWETAQAARKVVGEAFTAARTGQPLSTEIKFQGPTWLHQGEGGMNDGAIAMPSGSLAVSQTLHMSGSSLHAAVKRMGQEVREMRSLPIDDNGRWLGSVVRGWLNHHAIPGNSYAITSFLARIAYAWRRALRLRSQRAKTGTSWAVMTALVDRYIPKAIILHGYPNERLRV